jgi:hypothetical protein
VAWEIARVSVAAAAVLFLPGWLLVHASRWELVRGVRLAEIPLAFALSIAIVSVLGVSASLVGLGLGTLLQVIIAIDALALLRIAVLAGRQGLRRTGSLPEWAVSPAEAAIAGFAVVAAGAAAWAGVWFSRTADTFYHMAAVRRLLHEDDVLVSKLIYADSARGDLPAGLDPTSGTWHLALALVAKASGLDIVTVWTLLPPLMALLLVLAFYTLAVVLFQNRWWALAATVIQFTLFVNMDFRTSLYPNVISKALLWVALAAAFRYLSDGDRRGFAVAGVVAFSLASVHMFAVELYLLSLVVLAAAAALLVRWRSHLFVDLRRLALLAAAGGLAALPIVVAKARGAGLATVDERGGDEYGALVSLGDALEKVPLLESLGNGALSRITSLSPSHWAADHLFVYSRTALGYGDLMSAKTATFLLVLLLLPGFFRGRRLNMYLVATTLVVPLIVLNPLLVKPLSRWVDDIALLRLPQLIPDALVWVAVLAPLAGRLGRLAQRRRLELARRYAVVSLRGWPFLGRLASVLPAPGLIGVYGLLVAPVIAVAAVFAAGGLVNGLLYNYLPSEGGIYSVHDSKSTTLHYDRGLFGYLRENATADAVVLADPVSSYYISGFVGTPVVAVPWKHSPRRAERTDGDQRRLDAAAALNGHSASDALRVVREYRVTYLVTDGPGPTLFDGMPEMFRLVFKDGRSRIYEYQGP